MTTTTSRVPAIAGVLLLLLGIAAGARADEIRLSRSAHVVEGRPVRLADVAELDGRAAEALADTVVLDRAPSAAARTALLSADDVRAALRAADARLGSVALSGSSCVLVLRAGNAGERPERAEDAPEASKPAEAGWWTVPQAGAVPSLRQAIGDALRRELRAEPETLRLRFVPSEELALATEVIGRRVDVEVRSRPAGRMIVRALVYAPDGSVVLDETLRPEVELRRRVLRATRSIARDVALDAANVERETLWLPPGGVEPLPPDGGWRGSVATLRIAPGAIVREGDVEAPLLVHRGTDVEVHCHVRGIVIRTPARALESGRLGERVACRVANGRRTFRAVVDGPDRVIVVLDATEED